MSRWPRPAPARACGYAGGLRPLGPLPATMLSLDLGLLTPRGADVTFAPPPRRGTGVFTRAAATCPAFVEAKGPFGGCRFQRSANLDAGGSLSCLRWRW